MTNNVAIYARVSTEDQAERQTIEAQLHACREHCTRKGYLVVAEFCEEGVSGTVPFEERPQGERLLKMAEQGMFSATVVYCLDRLGRDVVEVVEADRLLKRNRASLEFVTQSFDGSPEGEFMFTVFAAVAQLERRVIARRMSNGRYRRTREGAYMPSIVAYGYRKEDGRAEADEEEAAIVRQMFSWATVEDMGCWAIAERLNTMGITPPRSAIKRREENRGKWGPTTIAKILSAERYTGNGSYGPEVASYPPIIKVETFQAARAALSRRRTAYLTGATNGYLLAGSVRCRVCGSACTGVKTGRNQRPAYHCGGYRRGRREGHGRYYWYADGVEEWVQGQLRTLLYKPESLQNRVEAWLERELSAVQPLLDETDRLRKQLAEGFPAQEERVLEHARKGLINDEQLSRQLEAIAAERVAAQSRLEELRDERDRGIDYMTDFKSKLHILREVRDKGLQAFQGGVESAVINLSPAYDRPTSAEEYKLLMRELGVTVYLEANGGATIEMGFRLAANSYLPS